MLNSTRDRFRSLRAAALKSSNASSAGRQHEWPVRFEDRRVYGTNGALDAMFRVRIANGIETVIARTEYDPAGRIRSQSEAAGLVTEYTYDNRGHLIQTRRRQADSDGASRWFASRTVYDPAGRSIATSDEHREGTASPIPGTRTTYDSMGRVLLTERFSSIVISLTGTGANVSTAVGVTGAVISSRGATDDDLEQLDNPADDVTPDAMADLADLSDNVQFAECDTLRDDGKRGDLVETLWLATGNVTDIFDRKCDKRARLGEGQFQGTSLDLPVYKTNSDFTGKVVRCSGPTSVVLQNSAENGRKTMRGA